MKFYICFRPEGKQQMLAKRDLSFRCLQFLAAVFFWRSAKSPQENVLRVAQK